MQTDPVPRPVAASASPSPSFLAQIPVDIWIGAGILAGLFLCLLVCAVALFLYVRVQAAKDAEVRAELAALREIVTRANFNRLAINMTLADVEQIIGPGRESSRSAGYLSVMWRSADGKCTITGLFQMAENDPNPWLVSKAVRGD